jgi:hypothetical protein
MLAWLLEVGLDERQSKLRMVCSPVGAGRVRNWPGRKGLSRGAFQSECAE